MSLLDRILDRVSAGPIPFEEFQRTALYDPDGGFFAGDTLRSTKAGDFLTSPEVSALFGETLAEFVRRESERLGSLLTVVEVAAGSGTLLAPLLAASDVVDAWAVEVSPPARAALVGVVGSERVVDRLADVPGPFDGVILANELIDNLPVAVAARTGGGWEERWVSRDGDRLTFVAAPVRQDVAAWCEAYAGPVEVGGLVEVQLEAAAWVRAALAKLARGALVLIDYGDTADGLAPRRSHGTLRTYRSHHLGPDPLLEPGETDITVDVNFTALADIAEQAGAQVDLVRQDDFLNGLGLRDRLSELRHQELALARGGDPMERLRVRSQRTEAETLMHPRGLGDFRVLVARSG